MASQRLCVLRDLVCGIIHPRAQAASYRSLLRPTTDVPTAQGHAHGPVPRCKGPGAESGKIALQARAGSIDAWKPAAPSTHWAGQSRARGKEGPGDALAGHAAESGGGVTRLGFAGLCDLWAVAWRRAQGC